MAITATVAGIAAAGTAAQIDAAKSQKRAARRAENRQKEANRIEKAKSAVQRAVERRKSVQQLRQAQAFNIAGGVASGFSEGSSAIQGVNSALGSNFASGVASQNRSFVSGQQSFDLRNEAQFDLARTNANAALKSAYGSAAQQLSFAALPYTPAAK